MFADSSVVVLLTLGAYLVGSLSFAVIVSRLMGLDDPRTYGSQNPGATNVLRSGNKQAAVATFGLDDRAVALVAISAFIGHLWPVFFAFKGGKGVATAAGILFGVEPLLGAAVMGTWLIVAFFFRYSSLAALAASLFAPAYYLFGNQIAWQTSDAELLAVAVMSALLLMRHKDNIARLVSGQETKIGAKKDAS